MVRHARPNLPRPGAPTSVRGAGPWSPTPSPPGLPPTWSAAPYAGEVRQAVVAWKDGGRADLTPVLAPVLRAVLAAGSGKLSLYDVQTGRRAERLEGISGGVSTAAFLPDGRRVLLGCYNASVQLWRLRDNLVAGR